MTLAMFLAGELIPLDIYGYKPNAFKLKAYWAEVQLCLILAS